MSLNQLLAQAKWVYVTPSVTELLGWEPQELRGRPSIELVHPDEMVRVRKLHYDTIRQDKAACLVYIRMKHKIPSKGYILCGVVRAQLTIVHNVTVGSVSFANSPSKAFHNASTAQEVTVISPTPELEFRRWHDPSPMPPVPVPAVLRKASQSSPEQDFSPPPELDELFTYDPLPSQSFRTAFILDRFSVHCTILYYSNSLLITANRIEKRSFFDFVVKSDETTLRSWIETIKGWGVNELGQPSDGGFGFGKFSLLPQGRDYLAESRPVGQTLARQRHYGPSHHRVKQDRSSVRGGHGSDASALPSRTAASPEAEPFAVDAIFSAHSDGLVVILRRGN
ncbi:hypothetical protein J3R30DRAFT_3287051 [Lentinula aciculospora]|uniref:PAS domain-containing protein n=1 Tax=Lentinula aciculospora TaxID=153920 RepID=A0A9W9AI41_9AGAR|nr:hypothetical protein J3R30DRAFT_3287051 [Lentinula aciculospora]